jgi:hypothetical protein
MPATESKRQWDKHKQSLGKSGQDRACAVATAEALLIGPPVCSSAVDATPAVSSRAV